SRLPIPQSRVQAVLTQTYELREYPIPRLFVVLPQDPSGWDTLSPFSNKFHRYFLCECGGHTKSINNKTEISHGIHFAKHEGYQIVRPSEFFQQHGPYVFTILRMLKLGVSVAGVADNIEPGMDHIIDWMNKVSADEGEAVDEFAQWMEKKEVLEGTDLRKLGTFLKDNDGNKVSGNLYRIVTNEDHVKWVCIDQLSYELSRERSQGVPARVVFRFNENVVKSIGRAVLFGTGKARFVYELDINLDWAVLKVILKYRRMHSGNQEYQFFALDFNNFGRASIRGKEFGILAEVLKTNLTLTTWNLRNNSIGDDGAKALAEALKTNSTCVTRLGR
ncbi:hypothetical protein BGZ95_004768, partial [Linnemannia exigua]